MISSQMHPNKDMHEHHSLSTHHQSQHMIIKELNLKKTRKGWIGNKSKLIHLRDDIPTGFQSEHMEMKNNKQIHANINSSLLPSTNSYQTRNSSLFNNDPTSEDDIYFIDSYTLINNSDIIYNCQELKNVIILQSSVEKLKNYNPNVTPGGLQDGNGITAGLSSKRSSHNVNSYNGFKNFMETIESNLEAVRLNRREKESRNKSEKIDVEGGDSQMMGGLGEESEVRKVHIFADKYHKSIHLSKYVFDNSNKERIVDESSEGIDQGAVSSRTLKNSDPTQSEYFSRVISWYTQHCRQLGLLGVKFHLLSSNPKLLKQKPSLKYSCLSLMQYLQQHTSATSTSNNNTSSNNLLDYIGFDLLAEQQQLAKLKIFSKDQFEQHLSISEYTKKLQEGKIFEGKYMGEEKSYFKVNNMMIKADIENNRAFFGDVVMVELESDRKKWRSRFQTMKLGDQDDGQNEDALASVSLTEDSSSGLGVENRNLLVYLKENPEVVPKGRVVAIKRRQVKNVCGSIGPESQMSEKQIKSQLSQNQMQIQSEQQSNPTTVITKNYSIYKFHPVDSRYPPCYIKTYNPESLLNKRIMVTIDEWPSNSQYPLCHYIRTIGSEGNVKTQGDVILHEHNVQTKQFSRQAYECLPKDGKNFKIPQIEFTYRQDLRHIDVCSVDPPGCKDIDDALHCIQLGNGNLQIGVHIADVTYYMKPDTSLDLEARNRCTSVYLADRRTDMLPKLLTEDLCSLRADVDRLAFSVIWEIDQKNANIIKSRYGKSIIRSRRAFTYMQAQQLKDSNDQGALAKSIRNLNKIALILKEKRRQLGALTLASTQVKIKLAEQTHTATDISMYQMVETNHMIEEFMLLANISVAERIYERFPALSILRRHTQPKMSDLGTMKEIMMEWGYDLEFDTSKELAESLDRIQREGDPFFNKLVRIMTTRCMNEATYFCSADFDLQEFYHYGLATNFYTHFTSPIRRYADVLVHRLLAAAIDLEPLPNFMINKLKMTKICEKMNTRNRMARYASRASSDYHTYLYFKDRQQTPETVIVTSITEQYVTLMLIKYGLECRLELTQEEQDKTKKLNKNKKFIKVGYVQEMEVSLFEYLRVKVKVEMKGFHKKMVLTIVGRGEEK